MSYWKSKVVPKFKKLFQGKKKLASEACKSFDSSKESLEKEIGEKTPDLHPKVVEIYKASTVVSKKLLKEPSEPGVKENPTDVQAVLTELAKAGFPGAQVLCDAGVKYGPALLPGPIVYLFSKTSTFLVEESLPEETREIPVEEVKKEAEGGSSDCAVAETPVEEKTEVVEAVVAIEEPCTSVEEKKEECVVCEEKKEEAVVCEEKKEEAVVCEEKKEEVAEACVEKKEEVVTPPAAAC